MIMLFDSNNNHVCCNFKKHIITKTYYDKHIFEIINKNK